MLKCSTATFSHSFSPLSSLHSGSGMMIMGGGGGDSGGGGGGGGGKKKKKGGGGGTVSGASNLTQLSLHN